ncbi:Cytochrome c biogenesis factor [Geoglobus acetivorans]|uniref:Cytochrome c biogenesis factor n=2 Tax=Geoglobus acetivorans TaxID=565033 RepID=A0A0A7GBD8_GEOAI|nr:Cytochrome c biogenesis factor [Geoglobus acetivorans]
MSMERAIAKRFGLESPEDWMRHANPRSVITRFTTLPLLVLAVWSRVWLGWYSLIFVGVVVAWSMINPTLFAKQTKIDSWWSKCVAGEYFWANRDKFPVADYHYGVIRVLTFLQAAGGVFLIVGMYLLDVWMTIAGVVWVYLSKMWFLDRMVWIYEEMKDHAGELERGT